jgi:hypothetical protein
MELKFNCEVLTVTAAWLAERCGKAQNVKLVS